ncbi:IS110 family transposase [Candidatus Cardinium hertigii]|uniref:Transposase IS110-like N-terminal domain-containing protein n=1 Tax=Candidatus Cardinium hertigii TaxID=247481 RepID=A0A2Z3L7S5_9BACT|nr:IS110 family transposase [Candidatus Cardinium hertigii]AWN81688.1 hypothetical protein DK880_00360 [Candidatus Cardinium hertigii]
MQYIGIDIGKRNFIAAFPQDQGYRTITYKNEPKGIETFLAQLDKSADHCVLEATGNYGALLLQMLTGHGIVVSMVNPKQTKQFARMMLVVNKTDKVDAQLIALIS